VIFIASVIEKLVEFEEPRVYCQGWNKKKLSDVLNTTTQKPANIYDAYYSKDRPEQLILRLRVEGAFTNCCAIVPRLEFINFVTKGKLISEEQKGAFVIVQGLEGKVTAHIVAHRLRSINSIYGISLPKYIKET
jgi:hypothetical protein